MVSQKQLSSVSPWCMLPWCALASVASVLLVLFTSFGGGKSGCQSCFARDADGNSIAADLVIISSDVVSSGVVSSGVVSSGVVSSGVVSPGVSSPLEAKKRFVAALRLRAKACFLADDVTKSPGDIVEGSQVEVPMNQQFVSILTDLSGQQEESVGETIRCVAAEEVLLAPGKLSVVPKEQSQQAEELLGPNISSDDRVSSDDWVSTSDDVDTMIINDLSADVRPKIRGKQKSKQDNQIYTDEMPKNFAARSQGAYEDSPLVGVGARRFETGNYVLWAAPKFHHRPLYFEEPNLERYGHYVGGQCIQSAVSTAHFFGSIPLLPYKMGANPPRSCHYTLGRFRPGNCNPRVVEIPEFSPRGFLYQGLFTTGAAFIVP